MFLTLSFNQFRAPHACHDLGLAPRNLERADRQRKDRAQLPEEMAPQESIQLLSPQQQITQREPHGAQIVENAGEGEEILPGLATVQTRPEPSRISGFGQTPSEHHAKKG